MLTGKTPWTLAELWASVQLRAQNPLEKLEKTGSAAEAGGAEESWSEVDEEGDGD